MKHFLLFYTAAPDYLERRAQFRDAHLQKAWASHTAGELVLGGALTDPADGAVLLFAGEDKSAAEKFAKSDPYVTNGLVTSWRVREWVTVAGEAPSKPTRPSTSASETP